MKKEKRVLPADVYDTLELSALAFGGIGSWVMFEREGNQVVAPHCVMGHALFASGEEEDAGTPVYDALKAVGVDVISNDNTLDRLGVVGGADKLPFPEWCKALNVVRGE